MEESFLCFFRGCPVIHGVKRVIRYASNDEMNKVIITINIHSSTLSLKISYFDLKKQKMSLATGIAKEF